MTCENCTRLKQTNRDLELNVERLLKKIRKLEDEEEHREDVEARDDNGIYERALSHQLHGR